MTLIYFGHGNTVDKVELWRSQKYRSAIPARFGHNKSGAVWGDVPTAMVKGRLSRWEIGVWIGKHHLDVLSWSLPNPLRSLAWHFDCIAASNDYLLTPTCTSLLFYLESVSEAHLKQSHSDLGGRIPNSNSRENTKQQSEAKYSVPSAYSYNHLTSPSLAHHSSGPSSTAPPPSYPQTHYHRKPAPSHLPTPSSSLHRTA